MNSIPCCHSKARDQKTGRSLQGIAAWLVPSALLALMPKCPLCLATYVALCAGVTISGWSAQLLMRTVTALCLGTLALCATRRVVSFRNQRTFNLQPTETH